MIAYDHSLTLSQSRGLSVWFDQNEIDEFAPITDKIRHGLANSKALLVWYSVDYPRSRPCQMELTAAFIAAQREGDPRQRVWVINPEPTPITFNRLSSAMSNTRKHPSLAPSTFRLRTMSSRNSLT